LARNDDGNAGVPRLVAFPRRIASRVTVEMLWCGCTAAEG